MNMPTNLPVSCAVVPYQHQMVLAKAFASSGLFGIKTEAQALSLMALCEAENLHPAIAVRDFHIIQGRATLKADAMMSRFQACGGTVKWTTYTNENVTGIFSHPAGGSVTIEWTIAQAKAAGLAGKDTWKQYPRQMLRARVISEGIRTVYPGCMVGMYTPEEVQDFDVTPPVSDNVQEAEVIDEPKRAKAEPKPVQTAPQKPAPTVKENLTVAPKPEQSLSDMPKVACPEREGLYVFKDYCESDCKQSATCTAKNPPKIVSEADLRFAMDCAKQAIGEDKVRDELVILTGSRHPKPSELDQAQKQAMLDALLKMAEAPSNDELAGAALAEAGVSL